MPHFTTEFFPKAVFPSFIISECNAASYILTYEMQADMAFFKIAF